MPEFSGTYYTFADLYAGSRAFLRVIEEQEKGALVYYSCMSVIIFSAFCLESYLNHLGPTYYPSWENSREDKGEGWRDPREKLDLICNKIDFSPNLGQRPFQSFSEIFRFRNLIAHSKSETLKGNFVGEAPKVKTEIQKKATPEHSRRYYEDTDKMIRRIHHEAGFKEDPFFAIAELQWGGD